MEPVNPRARRRRRQSPSPRSTSLSGRSSPLHRHPLSADGRRHLLPPPWPGPNRQTPRLAPLPRLLNHQSAFDHTGLSASDRTQKSAFENYTTQRAFVVDNDSLRASLARSIFAQRMNCLHHSLHLRPGLGRFTRASRCAALCYSPLTASSKLAHAVPGKAAA
jgi:hypothetical protein